MKVMRTLFVELAITIGLLLLAPLSFADRPKYGPQASRLAQNHSYLQKNTAIDYWALAGYYVPQQNPRACSLASVAMLVNGARAKQNLSASDELVTQDSLLKKLSSTQWPKAVGEGGRGITLDELEGLVKMSLVAYGFKEVNTQVIHADGSLKTNTKILDLLATNEKSGDNFVLANFLQSEYTGDPEGAIGHIAPVAAYDAVSKKVLIFDPDRQYYEPYWVTTDAFLKGLTTEDKSVKKNRGILYVSFKR